MATEPYTQTVLIDASPEQVFRYSTEPKAIVAWMGDEAVVDPRPGGRFSLRFDERVVEGKYVAVVPPHRLVITWGRRGSRGFAPESSTLQVTLTPEDGGTRVTIVHHGLPVSERQRHADGWRHYIGRLEQIAAGRQVAPHHVPQNFPKASTDNGSCDRPVAVGRRSDPRARLPPARPALARRTGHKSRGKSSHPQVPPQSADQPHAGVAANPSRRGQMLRHHPD